MQVRLQSKAVVPPEKNRSSTWPQRRSWTFPFRTSDARCPPGGLAPDRERLGLLADDVLSADPAAGGLIVPLAVRHGHGAFTASRSWSHGICLIDLYCVLRELLVPQCRQRHLLLRPVADQPEPPRYVRPGNRQTPTRAHRSKHPHTHTRRCCRRIVCPTSHVNRAGESGCPSSVQDLYNPQINAKCAAAILASQGLNAWQTWTEGKCNGTHRLNPRWPLANSSVHSRLEPVQEQRYHQLVDHRAYFRPP